MKYNLDNFRNTLISLRKKQGWTQTALAEIIGISPQAISKWERGIGYPDVTLIPKIAEIFSVSTEVLFGEAEQVEVLLTSESYDVFFETCDVIHVKVGNICRVQHIYEEIEGCRISVTGDPAFLKNFKAEHQNGTVVINIKNPNGSELHWEPYDRKGFKGENLVCIFSNGNKRVFNINYLDLCMCDGENDQGYFVYVCRELFKYKYDF